MQDKKHYAEWAPEALLKEAGKIKKRQIVTAFIIGFLAGVIVYGLMKRGFGFVYMSISVILIMAIYRNSKTQTENLKQI